ncbi:tRNA pseudouridine(13) synthase TruD [Candidatus Woesearchaeota archaeon]|jgi:tRNA pseudouridine13 synthase|nr:tRNA pseudouridine(13) synthase TruD [Candidatus Woesearchaeota archaeon]MBT4368627.1 tRNA pseudouridine(13) synthase TruD [Candidatus Woesearchaeota archaeon]MBT4713064.1 tRNA pseudouridine(13) synthase TruD [Candidatus Woesearchaeota archaeon]MBT6638986.1 tRNA pseudouridine(13) synthase TruD [Candidatus Woesearchaeota archaeon]MBT7134185.1 tRNA pseudouridine(13) synthase TruD [Candidatus Woesearchaeota archaeon]
MKLKQTPSDFIVKEKSNVVIGEKGDYTYFLMEKENYNTVRALEAVAKALHTQFRNIGFAGNKDKKAITSQVCSVKFIGKDKLERTKLEGIKLTYLGKGDKPVSLGDLDGNNFEIIIYDVEEVPEKITKFVNYYGPQRFGGNNAEVGRAIVKKDFKKACNLLELDDSNAVLSLRGLNKKVLTLYIHAYQSWIWNESINLDNSKEEVELIGFGNHFQNQITKSEEIKPRDFIIRQIPEISSEGDIRKVWCEVKDLEIEKVKEGIKLKFFLPKGSYATVFIDQLINAPKAATYHPRF